MNKIGFACKYMHVDRTLSAKDLETIERQYNTKTTTSKWLMGVDINDAYAKLFMVVEHNLASQLKLLEYVNTLPEQLRMVRLSSDLLPLYSHHAWGHFYKRKDVIEILERGFSKIGEYARQHKIRMSMHPGQFCVLASERADVVTKSIAEFEYHVDMIRMMGYGQSFQDFKCNIHIAGTHGVEGTISVLPLLSSEARNSITFENEEKKYGLDDCIKLSAYAPVVLDVHHCWIHEGEYIDINDDRIQRVIESWRGVRPTMHYSQSREFIQDHFNTTDKLEVSKLMKHYNKKDLYGHSDYMWNDWSNRYVKEFMPYFDIMFEVKSKNLATIQYYENYLK
jgi:UV DNA damage repair endonuclease